MLLLNICKLIALSYLRDIFILTTGAIFFEFQVWPVLSAWTIWHSLLIAGVRWFYWATVRFILIRQCCHGNKKVTVYRHKKHRPIAVRHSERPLNVTLNLAILTLNLTLILLTPNLTILTLTLSLAVTFGIADQSSTEYTYRLCVCDAGAVCMVKHRDRSSWF